MKKSRRVGDIWTIPTVESASVVTGTESDSVSNKFDAKYRRGPQTNTSNTVTAKTRTMQHVERGRMCLKNFENDAAKKAATGFSLMDQEEAKARKESGAGSEGKLSWVDFINKHKNLLDSRAFSETVSMQGLAPIFDPTSSRKRKLFWCFVVVLAIAFTGFNIYQQILMYLSTPITVRVDFHKVQEISFPALTICNNNFASYSSAAFFNVTKTLLLIKPLLFAKGGNLSRPDFSLYDFSPYRVNGWDVFYQMLTQNFHQMVIWVKCQWEQSKCSVTNFTVRYTDMGLCYTFNVNGTLKAREAGRAYGLKLTLDAHQADYLRSFDDYYGAGFRVVVHSPNVPPIMAERGVAVSPGFHNFLPIEVKQLINAEESVSGCGSQTLQYHDTYSTEACRLECRTDAINRSCGCRDVSMPNTRVRICDPPELYDCLLPAIDRYLEGNSDCEDQCPEPCSEFLYRVTPSANPLSAKFLEEFSTLLSGNATHWGSNLVHLEIYLTSMTLETVEKQLGYTLLQLFCDVGGAFGLLLGASLLTLLEIVDYFVCRFSAAPSRPQGVYPPRTRLAQGEGAF